MNCMKIKFRFVAKQNQIASVRFVAKQNQRQRKFGGNIIPSNKDISKKASLCSHISYTHKTLYGQDNHKLSHIEFLQRIQSLNLLRFSLWNTFGNHFFAILIRHKSWLSLKIMIHCRRNQFVAVSWIHEWCFIRGMGISQCRRRMSGEIYRT